MAPLPTCHRCGREVDSYHSRTNPDRWTQDSFYRDVTVRAAYGRPQPGADLFCHLPDDSLIRVRSLLSKARRRPWRRPATADALLRLVQAIDLHLTPTTAKEKV